MTDKREEFMARNILNQIIRLYNFNNLIGTMFGKSDDDNMIGIAVDNLLDTFFELSGMNRLNGFDEDYILDEILRCDSYVLSDILYDKFLTLEAAKGE